MTSATPPDDAVAIVAMAGRFPGASSVAALWDLVLEGRSALSSRTEAELREAGVSAELLARPDYVRKTMLLAEMDLFAARFFGYSQRQAEELDPQQRLFLEYAWMAAEQAGFNPETSSRVTGVFASVSANRYALGRLWHSLGKPGASGYFQASLDSDKDFLATRVAYKLDLRGPAITVQTACSSSLVAVHLACQSLLSYECDEALAGGVSLQIPHGTGYLFVDGGVAARDGVCRPFADRATGTVQGSGVGIVALKRLADALADGDPIIAVIRGSAINNDGACKAGFTAPSVDGQIDVIRRAMTGVPAASIGLIEAHGTGTLQGDAIELTALAEIYRQAGVAPQACAIGSVKGHIGHLDVASGIAGLIKASLCLRHRTLPPSTPVEVPNKILREADCPFYLNGAGRSWENGSRPRRAAVSSFGMGGTNAHVIIEEAPSESAASAVEAENALLTLSAKGPEELREVARQLAAYLRGSAAAPLSDVAHTLLFGRRRFPYRRWLTAADAGQAAILLEKETGDVAIDERTRFAALLIGDPMAEGGPPPRGPGREDAVHAKLVADCLSAWPDRNEAEKLESWFLAGVETDALPPLYPAIHAIGAYCAGAWLANQGVGFSAFLTVGRGLWIAAALMRRLPLADALLLAAGRREWSGQQAGPARGRQTPVYSVDPPPAAPLSWRPLQGARMDVQVWIDLSAPGGACFRRLRELGEAPPEATLSLIPAGEGGRAAWLECVGRLWALGIPFRRERKSSGPRLAPLPSYPWRRDVCWLPPELPSAAIPETPQGTVTAGLEILRPYWEATGAWQDSAAEANAASGELERWILFGAEHPLAAEIAAQLSANAAMAEIRTGDRFEKRAAGDYSVDPGKPDEVAALCRELAAEGWQGARAISLWPLVLPDPAAALLHLAQKAATVPGGVWQAMLAVTMSLFSDALEPEPCRAAGLTGLAKVIAQEMGVPWGIADFSSATFADRTGSARAASALLAEARALRGAPLAVFRGRTRFVPAYHQARWPEQGPRRSRLKQGGRYLITGGFGALGLALAHHLSRRYQARLGLLSRTALPDRAAWPDVLSAADPGRTELRSRLENIVEIESHGGQVLPLVADVSEAAALETAVRRGEEHWGGWDGVFHLAVENRGDSIFKPIAALKAADFEAQARPKREGVRVLDALFGTRTVDFKLAFSSIAVQLGGFGLGAYAAANAHLDHQTRGWISVNWDAWALTSPPETVCCIDTAAGLEMVEAIVGNVAEGGVLVSAGDFRLRAETWLNFESLAGRTLPDTPEEDTLGALLRRVWNHVLGLREGGGDENFSDSGGDSLIAMQLIELIQSEIGISVPIEKFISGNITVKKLEIFIIDYIKSLENEHVLD